MTLRDCFDQHRGRLVAKIDHFFDVYEPHLARYRDTPVRVLEIGVGHGGSLELWRNYFGPRASIHGIDINPKAAERAPADTTVHIGSQDDMEFLLATVTEHGPFDVVIDDGSHLMHHQIRSFEVIYPRMHESGVYICEDAFTSYWKEFGGRLREPGTFMEYAKARIDELHAYWATDAGLQPSEFTRSTRGIHFYSGTVVFQRHPIDRPVYVLRHREGFTETDIDDLKATAAGQNLVE